MLYKLTSDPLARFLRFLTLWELSTLYCEVHKELECHLNQNASFIAQHPCSLWFVQLHPNSKLCAFLMKLWRAPQLNFLQFRAWVILACVKGYISKLRWLLEYAYRVADPPEGIPPPSWILWSAVLKHLAHLPNGHIMINEVLVFCGQDFRSSINIDAITFAAATCADPEKLAPHHTMLMKKLFRTDSILPWAVRCGLLTIAQKASRKGWCSASFPEHPLLCYALSSRDVPTVLWVLKKFKWDLLSSLMEIINTKMLLPLLEANVLEKQSVCQKCSNFRTDALIHAARQTRDVDTFRVLCELCPLFDHSIRNNPHLLAQCVEDGCEDLVMWLIHEKWDDLLPCWELRCCMFCSESNEHGMQILHDALRTRMVRFLEHWFLPMPPDVKLELSCAVSEIYKTMEAVELLFRFNERKAQLAESFLRHILLEKAVFTSDPHEARVLQYTAALLDDERLCAIFREVRAKDWNALTLKSVVSLFRERVVPYQNSLTPRYQFLMSVGPVLSWIRIVAYQGELDSFLPFLKDTRALTSTVFASSLLSCQPLRSLSALHSFLHGDFSMLGAVTSFGANGVLDKLEKALPLDCAVAPSATTKKSLILLTERLQLMAHILTPNVFKEAYGNYGCFQRSLT